MDSGTFKKKVKKELKNLNREQLVQFAWRCAVRALPFLGKDGSLSFWDNKNNQKHIYAVFNAFVGSNLQSSNFRKSKSSIFGNNKSPIKKEFRTLDIRSIKFKLMWYELQTKKQIKNVVQSTRTYRARTQQESD